MKTLQQIKDEYANSIDFSSWEGYISYCDNTEGGPYESDWEEVCKIYARECCKATLEEAAENAYSYEDMYGNHHVERYSITNEDNIVLL